MVTPSKVKYRKPCSTTMLPMVLLLLSVKPMLKAT